GGSEWATCHGLRGGLAPAADLDVAAALHDFVRALVDGREVTGVHDVSDGGLAIALAEMAIAGGVGCKVDLAVEGCTVAEACFSESTSRVVVTASQDRLASVLGQAAAAGVPARVIGEATGSRRHAIREFDAP